MLRSDATGSAIMAALEQFEATEANLIKLERLWDEMAALIPTGIAFGGNVEYEDRARSFDVLVASLPKIGGWKPTATPPDLDGLAQSRLDAMELDEPSAHVSVERWIEEPGRELQEYRFRFNNMRRALIRDALIGLIDQIDADLRGVRAVVGVDAERRQQIDKEVWSDMREHMKQIEVLLGSSVKKPARWSDMMRHIHFGCVGDLHDIEAMDWPDVKDSLRKGLYGVNEAVPVQVEDLSALVATRPTGPITTALSWSKIDDQTFERLIFTLISDTLGYENPEWLMQTRAPDRGRDLSVMRVIQDELSGTLRLRVVIQCKHWTSRSVSLSEVSSTKDQMSLWPNPRVDVLIIATSGRFTADAVTWIEQHNANGASPRIEMWPESHLERLLAARPAIIAEFGLRGH
ncbi:restriction endonuclease [Rhizobiaceae bacterium LC148]|nr:restriction endonuclease [Rhizobiaceae bacterium LC148]